MSPKGSPMRAAEPVPGNQADRLPLPANVVTVPAGEILRILLFRESATYMLRSGPSVTPIGSKKEAETPNPFARAGLPEPATVETTPPGVMRLMRWFCVSATYKSNAALKARPTGFKNLDVVATPSAYPSTLPANVGPANVVTTAPLATFRILLFNTSAQYRSPRVGCTARPAGLSKRAPTPVPSKYPAVLPASVVTVPEAKTRLMR